MQINSAKIKLNGVILIPMVSLIIISCTKDIFTKQPYPAKPSVYFKTDNQYFYFTEAQIQRKKGDLDKAIILLKNAVEIDSESIYLQRELVTLYLQNKEDDNALDLLEIILEKHPDDIKSLILYGGIQQVRKENEAAISAYERVIELDSKQEKVYSLLGNLHIETGNLERANIIFTQLIEIFPASYAGHFYLGKIYVKQGKVQQAEAAFRRTLELAPDLLEPRFELLKLYKAEGRQEDVVQIYQGILNQNPNNIRAAMELGLYYHESGDTELAQQIFTKLGRRSKTEFEILVKVIQLYVDRKRYDDALVVLNGMLEGVPDSSDIHHITGIAYYSKDNYDTAISHFIKVMPDSRFYQDAVVHSAYIYQENGENQKALDYLKQAIENQPKNGEFRYYLGTFYEDSEDFENAEKYIKQAIELEPDNPKFYFRLGVVYDKAKKKEASMEAMRKVIALDPKHANALNYLGYTYADLGQNLDEAERLIKEALKYKPNDGYITDSLGWVYYKKGQFQKALKYLKKAVELVPDDPIMLEHVGGCLFKIERQGQCLEVLSEIVAAKRERYRGA